MTVRDLERVRVFFLALDHWDRVHGARRAKAKSVRKG